MKNFKVLFLLISIASAVVLFVGGVAIFVVGMTMLDWNFRRLDPDYGAGVVQRFNYTTEERNVLQVNVSNATSSASAGRNIVVTTRGNYIALYESDVEHFETTTVFKPVTIDDVEGYILNITIKSTRNNNVDGFWFRGMMPLRTRIYVPDGVTVNIGDSGVRFNGGVIVENISLQSLDIGTTSGAVRVENVTVAEKANIRNLSGSVRINGLVAGGDVEVNNTSGSIRIDGTGQAGGLMTDGDLRIIGLSGAIRARGRISADNIYVNQASGAVRLHHVTLLTGNLNFTNRSGAVRITIDGNRSDFNIDVTVASGSGRLQETNANATQSITGRVTSGSSRLTFAG
ncbi:MAG: DUF4097 domain-containing protein [Firmicutes bacterium]|nr:DUF4097 domain-containing protein [Bacillota bacterium]